MSYVVTGEVRRDGTVAVTERIRYHFTEPRHGMVRFIPLYYPLMNTDGDRDHLDARKIEVTDYSATMDGQAVPFVEDTAAFHMDEDFTLRVGDEDHQVTGEHDYRIEYTVHGLLNSVRGRPELFWDAVGGDSTVPVDHAEVIVTAPGPIGRVRGVAGVSELGAARVIGDSAWFVTDGIGAHTAVTVTVALPDTVTVPPPTLRAPRTVIARIVDNFLYPGREVGIPVQAVVMVIVAELAFGGLLVLVLYHSRRRAPSESTVVRSEPPAGVPAALCAVLRSGRVGRSVAAAVLTDLAARGLVSITEVPGGFQVALTGRRNDIRHKVHRYERPVVRALREPVTLTGDGRDPGEFSRVLGSLPEEVADEAIRREWFVAKPPDPVMVRQAGAILMVLSGVAALLAGLLGLALWAVPFGIAGVVLYRKPYLALRGLTAAGASLQARVVGFRRFLRTADPGRFAAADVRVACNRYLPYAVALGLADHWIARFAAAGVTPDLWHPAATGRGGAGYPAFLYAVDSSSRSPISLATSGTGSSTFTTASGFSGAGSGGGGGGGVGSW